MKNRNTILTTMLVALGFLAFSPMAQAVVPPPGDFYPGGNTAEGQNALLSLTTGAYNTADGIFSLLSLTDGNFNTAVGAGTLLANTANENTATGAGALFNNTTGEDNTADGAFALFSNTDGIRNTAIGSGALFDNTTGDVNTAIGRRALHLNTEGASNTAAGHQALLSNTTGSENTAVGRNALLNNTEAGSNTAVGHSALEANTVGALNCAFGWHALASNIGGGFLGGSLNTAVGASALEDNTDGAGNTALGYGAGSAITGGANICIGFSVTGVAGENNTIRVGDNLSDTQGDSACYIGGIYNQLGDAGTITAVAIDATGKLATAASSRRFKREIKPMDDASESILALKPVTFHYKSDKKNTPCFGLIAEEVAEVNPDLVVRNKNGEIWTVRYDQINAMLLNEFLKEHKKVEKQQINITRLNSEMANQAAIIAQQQKGMAALTAQLKEQAAQIQKVSTQVEMSKPVPQVVLNNH